MRVQVCNVVVMICSIKMSFSSMFIFSRGKNNNADISKFSSVMPRVLDFYIEQISYQPKDSESSYVLVG
jgi:hypothetical protein